MTFPEGRIAVMNPQGAEHRKRLGGVEFGNLQPKRVGGDRLNIEPGESLFGKISQVIGNDVRRAATDRCRKDMAVASVGKIECPDQRFVTDNQRIFELFRHCAPLRTDAALQMRFPIEQVPRPFVEYPLGPSGLEQARMMEAQQDVPCSKRKQDICIKDDDRTIQDSRQDASYSCPRRASSSSTALRAASRRFL